MSYRVLLVGTSSGGHAYPLVAVARALRTQAQQKNIKLDLQIMGESGFVEQAAKENNIDYKVLPTARLRRLFGGMNIGDLLVLPLSIIEALWNIFWYMPDAVFSKGGYDSFGPIIAAKIYFIDVYIHESDTVPGRANKITGRMAKKVFLAFASAAKYFAAEKTMVVGNPVRPELSKVDHQAGLSYFQLQSDIKTIAVFGGSRGAKQINDLILNSLVVLTEKYQIIHQCGQNNFKAVQAEVDKYIKEGEGKYADQLKARYRVYPFMNNEQVANAYGAADVIISRAGSGSLFEIAAVGKPAVIIPFPDATGNHQLYNAVEFGKFGAVVIEGANISTNILVNQVEALLQPEKHAEVSQKIKQFATPESADKIAAEILSS